LSLVDPDNRRPVDFKLRAELLSRARDMTAAQVLQEWDSGLPKLWMTMKILTLRRERSELFAAASRYQPLVAQGSHLGKLLAFRRGANMIAVVPRLTMSLAAQWGDTVLPLPGGEWRNCFTEDVVRREVAPASLFSVFPVALLTRVRT
jgi:(1->4)-alpha-D-glucan 1-alpha-D-glucosylmutase